MAAIGPPPPQLPSAVSVAIPSRSGSVLHGWWVPGVGDAAVVLMHGVHSNRHSMIERARVLCSQGYSALLFDFQAEGESPGSRITFGRLEAEDAAAAVDFVRHRVAGRVGAIGASLGGAAALLGPEPLPVDALILEAVYPEIGSALSNRLVAALGPAVGAVAAPLLQPLFEMLLAPLLQTSPKDLRPIDRVADVVAPLLVIAGEVDDRTTLAESRALVQRAPAGTLLWIVPGAGHVDLESFRPSDYWRHVLPFLRDHLRAPPPQ